MTSQAKKKIVIVGAGIVGVSTGLWLQRAGHEVVLIDRQEPGEGTSYGNAGILASCAIVPVTGPGLIQKAPGMLFDKKQPLFLKWRYLPKLFPWLIKYLKHANEKDTRRIAKAQSELISDSYEDHVTLSKGTKAERFVVGSDYCFLYKNRAEFEKESLAWDIRKQNGFIWRELEGAALKKHIPGISDAIGFAVSVPNHGRIIDPGAYVKALAEEICDNGGKFIKANVDDFNLVNGVLKSVQLGDKELTCDRVVIATGVWSKTLMAKLGLSIPLESERGYHIEFWNPSHSLPMSVMISSGKFAVTPMEGRLRAAGIVEFGGLDAPQSKAPFELLESRFHEAFPDITYERTERWMGHRPSTSDSLPLIGEVEGAKGVFTGFGHQHVGLTAGPKTGRLLAQLIDGFRPNVSLASFSPMRFD